MHTAAAVPKAGTRILRYQKSANFITNATACFLTYEVKLNVGHFACVIQNVGVTETWQQKGGKGELMKSKPAHIFRNRCKSPCRWTPYTQGHYGLLIESVEMQPYRADPDCGFELILSFT